MSPSPVLATTVEAARNMLREDIFFREEDGHVLFPVEGTEGAYLLCFVHWRFDGDTQPFMQTMELSNAMNVEQILLALDDAHAQFCQSIAKYKNNPELIPKAN